jgi:hypothetical protein
MNREFKSNDDILHHFLHNTIEGCVIRDMYVCDCIDRGIRPIDKSDADLLVIFIGLSQEKSFDVLVPLFELGYKLSSDMVDEITSMTAVCKNTYNLLAKYNQIDYDMFLEYLQKYAFYKINSYLSNPGLLTNMIKSVLHNGLSIENIEEFVIWPYGHCNNIVGIFLKEKEKLLAQIYMIWYQYNSENDMYDDQIFVQEISSYLC